VPLLPLALSSVVMGFGVMLLVKRGSVSIYVASRAALLWPFAYKQISAAFSRISPDVLSASRVLSPSPLDTVFLVALPQTRCAIFSAFALCFAAAASDASLPLMLAIPRFDTLALYIYRLAGAYRMGQACAAGIVLMALTCGVCALADALNRADNQGAKR
jgi:thiamine transport system permease protein